MTATGSCLCGGVSFLVEGELAPVQVCHCTQCQKAQGGPFATVIPVRTAAFRLLRGADLLAAYESSPGKQRVFCRVCGSPLYSRRDALPDVLRVRAGLLDGPLGVGVAWHQHTASACDWWPLPDDDRPSHPHAPGAAP